MFITVLESVLNRQNHKLKGKPLTVFRPSVDESEYTEASSEYYESTSEHIEPPNAIHVAGLPPGTTKDVLELFFSSEKRCGGGRIEESILYQGSCQAVIWFTDSKSK